MSFIEFKNICKKYAGNDKNSVTDFNLDIEEKELPEVNYEYKGAPFY